jgi:hypothetical protein
MSIVNIKLSDGEDGLNVFVNIDVTNFDKESIAVALGERVQDFLNGMIAEANKQVPEHPLLPKKELILPDSLTH